MILVYLADRTPQAAQQAAKEVKKYIAEQKLACPICTSPEIHLILKSELESKWMEIGCGCSNCGHRFGLSDRTMQGFWRGEGNKDMMLLGRMNDPNLEEKLEHEMAR